MPNLIPDSAPFSEEQRAWLNGFFSGLLGSLDAMHAPVGVNGFANHAVQELAQQSVAKLACSQEPEEDLPWHDPALSLAERMKLADNKPIARRMMAAMAQLDCGACGYVCKTYSEALARGSEKNLTLCSPGGSETSKVLRQLAKELSSVSASSANGSTNGRATHPRQELEQTKHGSRAHPVVARLLASHSLNKPGAAKDTRHVEIDLSGTSLKYQVGDALGIFPTNCPQLVQTILLAAGLDEATTVVCNHQQFSVKQVLTDFRCLRQITTELVESMQRVCGPDVPQQLTTFTDSEEMDHWDVLELLEAFPTIRISAQELVDALAPLRPRLYSIASSQDMHPTQLHLTVARVESTSRGRGRKGVASTMFADRAQVGQTLRIFIQPSHGFTIPSDNSAPMIMVGPGTGIAPFIAFLQQREQLRASGKNWLFFGDQHRASDFLYQPQLETWQRNGLLTRLDTAFSRDSTEKVYVQHRMLNSAEELFQWLEQGAYFFVCGNASHMAVDVDKTLHRIIECEGQFSSAAATMYVASLVKSKRYVRDVY